MREKIVHQEQGYTIDIAFTQGFELSPEVQKACYRIAESIAAGNRGEQEPVAELVINGESIELPAELARAFAQLSARMARSSEESHHRSVSSVDSRVEKEYITTGQAAKILGISRPTLVKMLDSSLLPYIRINSHRKLERAVVEEYARSHTQDLAFEEIGMLSQEMGLYDVDDVQILQEYQKMREESRVPMEA